MTTNIVLLCAAGMSTSVLVRKIQEAAKEIEFDCTVNAYGVSEAKSVVPDADVVLLGPQVRFLLKKVQADFPEKQVAVIDMRDYGTMNGLNVINTVKSILSI